MAFRRVTTVRGLFKTIHYSDNALTINRAAKNLKRTWGLNHDEELLQHFRSNRIHWNFIAKRAMVWRRVSGKVDVFRRISLEENVKKELPPVLIEVEVSYEFRSTCSDDQRLESWYPHSFALFGWRKVDFFPSKWSGSRRQFHLSGVVQEVKNKRGASGHVWKRWQAEYLLERRAAYDVENRCSRAAITWRRPTTEEWTTVKDTVGTGCCRRNEKRKKNSEG